MCSFVETGDRLRELFRAGYCSKTFDSIRYDARMYVFEKVGEVNKARSAATCHRKQGERKLLTLGADKVLVESSIVKNGRGKSVIRGNSHFFPHRRKLNGKWVRSTRVGSMYQVLV